MILSLSSRAKLRTSVCGASVWMGLAAMPALAQSDSAPVEAEEPRNEAGTGTGEIVVRAERIRGQLDVEQAPLLELNEEDIAAEGVTSIADLITQISNQTGSARGRGSGGRPIILINGIRVGSFREFANYPPEALERVEVFPEETAQRFGFAPDRRVINLILKENYSNAEVEFEFEGPSRGGYHRREQELGFLQIANGGRINVNFEANDTSLMTESERDIIQTPTSVSDVAGDPGQAGFRSLISDGRSLEGNLSWAKAYIDSGTSVSANLNYDRSDSRSLRGLNSVTLTDAAGNSAFRVFADDTPLQQISSTDTLSSSGSLTKRVNAFRLTSTYDVSYSATAQEIDQRFDTSGFEASALLGDLAIDAALPSGVTTRFDTADTRNIAFSTLNTLRGPLANLPGGELLATFDIGYSWTNLQTSDSRSFQDVSLTRGDLSTGVNLTIPITSRRNGFADALGSFTLNAQVGLDNLSDFGTLGDYTLGLTWAPTDKLNLSATYIQREVAPSLSALGNPEISFVNTPVFDFTNGETVLATVITGGNPDLLAETQRDWKFAANWELPFVDNTRFTVEYIRNRSDDVTRGFPNISPEIEAAFPNRVTRDTAGQLLAVDTRSVTFSETRADRIQFGLFTRGSIGAGQRGGRPGGGRPGGGRPQGAASGGGEGGSSGTQQPATRPEGQGRPQGGPPGGRQGGPPSAEQRAAFMEFRTRICADDGLDVLTRLVEAVENGEDLSTIVPGFDAQRFERLLSRVRDENGDVDPERLAAVRERICSFDPTEMGGRGRRGGPPADGQNDAPDGERPQGFAAFRAIACGEDGAARIRALITRIEAGEDVSGELPGFDPNMAGMMLGRLRDENGNITDERIAGLRERFCSNEQTASGGQGGQGDGQARGGGGSPAGFNPLARGSRPGFRYFLSLNHTIELENEIIIAPGLAPLNQLDGDATSAFGLPRQSTRLEGGIFGAGVGMRVSGRYTGETRLNGSGVAGSSDIFFEDLLRFDLRVFSNVGELVGKNEGVLKNLRISLRADNIFDARQQITDENGDTPINYQPFLIDPTGRFIGIDIRKLF
ncbi:hypothetical protein [Erythrobacter crassostreae]|uniref:TonB-dependent receptor plug domain-containing protein n=1 Tax=Erythrobacter crassostreae TaxID=2828328 RepID=A0A9X1JN93_9SPHN|nr:hypothetical protein [Erythrobacter crassostrea]MBV7259493.1 hypothetical protein [Erythrobacter crassostrea]